MAPTEDAPGGGLSDTGRAVDEDAANEAMEPEAAAASVSNLGRSLSLVVEAAPSHCRPSMRSRRSDEDMVRSDQVTTSSSAEC